MVSIERPGRESSIDLVRGHRLVYLVAAIAYLLARDRPAILLGCVARLYCVYLADEAGRAGWLIALAPYFRIGRTMASRSAVAFSGTILGVLLLRHRRKGGPVRALVPRVLGYAAGLAAAGLLLHTLPGLHPAFWRKGSRDLAVVPSLIGHHRGLAWRLRPDRRERLAAMGKGVRICGGLPDAGVRMEL
jgi:hypothetical protein